MTVTTSPAAARPTPQPIPSVPGTPTSPAGLDADTPVLEMFTHVASGPDGTGTGRIMRFTMSPGPRDQALPLHALDASSIEDAVRAVHDLAADHVKLTPEQAQEGLIPESHPLGLVFRADERWYGSLAGPANRPQDAGTKSYYLAPDDPKVIEKDSFGEVLELTPLREELQAVVGYASWYDVRGGVGGAAGAAEGATAIPARPQPVG